MSDLFGNHIVGFPTRWLICNNAKFRKYYENIIERYMYFDFLPKSHVDY